MVGLLAMQYQLIDYRWNVSYTDRNGATHSFWHPKTIIRSYLGPQEVTEDMIKQAFPTDEETEAYVNYMRANNITFDDESTPGS